MEDTSQGKQGLRQPSTPVLAGTSSSPGQQRRKVRGKSRSSRAYPSQGMDVKCCRRQHEVLVTYVRQTLQSWGPLDELPLSYWIDETVNHRKQFSPTPELKRVLTRAKILSEDCCREFPPLKAALLHGERYKVFADILKELQWCTSVVYHGSICRNVSMRSAPELKDFPWQAKIGSKEQFLLEKAEEEDWQELMQELENWNRDHVCNVEDCGNMHGQRDPRYCLASQVLQRLRPLDCGKDWRRWRGEFSLWSFDQEVVKHGRPLGSGAYGLVSEVTWLGFKYAQKIFNPAGLHSLQTEADALVKMNHAHIVKVFACSEDSLLMDLMCTDLHKFMKRRMKGGARVQPFSLPAAIDLMLQIADAVSYLHSQKMAHRDLKSSNVLVNPVNMPGLAEDDGFVFAKIADFGLAKIKREITRYSHLTHNIGTRKWMAPEIFGANIEDVHLEDAFPMKADVYSFGIVCFEILSGEEPFIDVRATDLYSKLTAPIPLRPQLPSSCPTNLASLICTCWDADPRKRPAFADVCRVLRYLKGLPTVIDLNDTKLVSIDVEWPFGRLRTKVKRQGRWGFDGFHFPGIESCFVGPLLDIRAVKIHFRDPEKLQLSGFDVAFDIRGQRYERSVGGGSGVSTDWITFDHPSEFLVQVEGSISYSESFLDLFPTSIESLSFITSRQKYGPFGSFEGRTTPFCSDPGRVVGLMVHFTATKLSTLEVLVVPNIIGCLRHYLEN